MSPWGQDTGSRAGRRHSLQEAKGRNESLERRALFEPQADLASDRSWEVKTAREVLRLPVEMSVELDDTIVETATVRHAGPYQPIVSR
jgi:hypothetical protein